MKHSLNHEIDHPLIAAGPTLAVVGLSGFNAQKRLLPELEQLDGRFRLLGFDLKPPADSNGIPCRVAQDNDDLARQLKAARPDVVMIETPCDCHPAHIRIALEAGAALVLCEKNVGVGVSRVADELMPAVRAAHPRQRAFIIDHYLGLDLVGTLHANAPRWLGDVTRMEVTLFEAQDVPAHQRRSHAQGMANFLHHAVALASLFFDLSDLVPVRAAWAKHPDANVPDTYRAAQFQSRRTGEVVLTGAVGKSMSCPRKLIRVEGTRGVAVLDREENELLVASEGGLSVDARCNHDSGYGALVSALAQIGHAERSEASCPEILPPHFAQGQHDNGVLLTIEQALRVLRLVEWAHAIATKLPFYPDGQEVVFE